MGVDWRKLRKVYVEGGNIPKPTKINKEGFPAYTIDRKLEIINLLMTGSTGNKFYVSGIQQVYDLIDTLNSYNDNDFIAKAILYSRLKGYMRDMPILGLALLSVRDIALFKRLAPIVCRTPTDWVKLIDICRSGIIRRGLGRAVKKAILMGISNIDIYQAMKYPDAVRTMIRLARPKETVNPSVIKYIMEHRYDVDDRTEALLRLKKTNNPSLAYELIIEYGLPYEVVTSIPNIIKYTETWRALLRVAPYMNLLRNLSTFYRKGVFSYDEDIEYAKNKLTNEVYIRNSKVLPFRYVSAYMSVNRYPEFPEELKSSIDYSAVKCLGNIDKLNEDVYVALDDSGSMNSYVTSENSKVKLYMIARTIAWVLLNRAFVTTLSLFGMTVRHNKSERLIQKERLMDFVLSEPPRGGTSLSAPIEELLSENIRYDRLIFITDNEEWVGDPVIKPLREYISRYPDTNVYFLTLTPYRDYPTPDMKNVYYVFGWSDCILRYITSDEYKQLEEVESIELP